MSLNSPLIVEETKQQNKKQEDRRELVEEVKKQLWLSGPLISVTLLNFGINLISVMFVGHLGELYLSGASMATSFASVTGFNLLVSFSQTCSVHHHY
jgi:MATE family multidrug resistance protein